jgi:hypothetical protein
MNALILDIVIKPVRITDQVLHVAAWDPVLSMKIFNFK